VEGNSNIDYNSKKELQKSRAAANDLPLPLTLEIASGDGKDFHQLRPGEQRRRRTAGPGPCR
jgi:hypothetical protein